VGPATGLYFFFSGRSKSQCRARRTPPSSSPPSHMAICEGLSIQQKTGWWRSGAAARSPKYDFNFWSSRFRPPFSEGPSRKKNSPEQSPKMSGIMQAISRPSYRDAMAAFTSSGRVSDSAGARRNLTLRFAKRTLTKPPMCPQECGIQLSPPRQAG